MSAAFSPGAMLADLAGIAPSLSLSLLRSSLLLIVVIALVALMRRTSAATRHLAWSLGLVGTLLIPLLSETVPWRWQILPPAEVAEAAAPSLPEIAPAAALPKETSAEDPAPAVGSEAGRAGVFFQRPSTPVTSREAPTVSRLPAQGAALDTGGFRLSDVTVWQVLLSAWLAGTVALLGWIVLGVFLVRRMVRAGVPVRDVAWIQLLQRLCDDMRIVAPVRLVRSGRLPMPVTSGVLAPVIILPDSAEDWDTDRRRAVLMHELAHVRRRDLVFHMISRIATALYWFNPLVWYASRKVRAESERACDDLVIQSGTYAPDYADHLLHIVRHAGRVRTPAAAVPMAQRSEFEGRLLAILEPGIKRHGLSVAKGLGITAILALSTVPLAIVGRAQAEAPPQAMIAEDEPTLSTMLVTNTVDAEHPESSPVVSPADTGRDQSVKTASSAVVDLPVDDPVPATPTTSAGDAPQANSTLQAGRPDPAAALLGALEDPDAGVRMAALESLSRLDDPRAVPAMLTALESEYPDMRRVAAKALGRSSEITDSVAIAALSRALRTDADPQVRKTAAWALGELEDPRAIPALSDALRGDANVEVRRTAAWALGEIEDPAALDALGAALADQSIEVRREAIEALGEIDDRRAIPLIMPLLDDPDPQVRRMAVWAFGEFEDPSTLEALGRATNDSNADVRRMAVYALGELEDARGVDYLIPMLNDSDVEVRTRAAWALGEIEDPRALDALVGALSDPSDEVRIRAVHSLGHLEDPRAESALVTALGDANVKVRVEAANALGEIELNQAPPALIEALNDPSPKVRKIAAHTLGEIGDPAAVEPLAVAVRDANRDVRMQALNALGEMGTERSVAILVEAMSDDDPEVRRMAARMLGNTRDR